MFCLNEAKTDRAQVRDPLECVLYDETHGVGSTTRRCKLTPLAWRD